MRLVMKISIMADHILLIRMIPTMNIIITEKANLLLTIEDKAFFKPKESVSAREETHKRHMEESQREQKRLMETLTQLKNRHKSKWIQCKNAATKKQQKERQLQMELANSVFSRGTNQQKSERQQEEKQEKIKQRRIRRTNKSFRARNSRSIQKTSPTSTVTIP